MTFPHYVLARMYEHIEPLDRGSRYEDPLQEALDAAQLGAVAGGGSQLNESGLIDFADIEIELANLDDAVDVAVRALEAAGAPEESEMLQGEQVLREFGRQQCLAIYFDGVSLPDEVYEDLDFEGVVDQITAAAGPGSYHGFSQGAEETGLYSFGADAEAMFRRTEPLLRQLPIAENARVVVRHSKPGLPARTIRMPRRDRT